MFDLDNELVQWRRRMSAGGLRSVDVLDELESHIREEFSRNARTDLDAHETFAAAVAAIGLSARLVLEFEKINHMPTMKSVTKILLGIAVLLIGLTIVMPALAKLNQTLGVSSLSLGWPLVLGSVSASIGINLVMQGMPTRKAKG
jgi:hypothetical protein